MSYNIPLDSSGDVSFDGTISASYFVGDGSQLTGIPGGISSNPFDQDLNTTDSPSFVDGTFSGNATVGIGGRVNWGDTNTSIRRSGTSLYWSIGGLSALTAHCGGSSKKLHWNENQNQDIDFIVGYNGGRGIDMDGATGNVTFGSDIISSVGGSYKLYNLGTDGDADTEYLETYCENGVQYTMESKATGAGVARSFHLKTGGFRLYSGGSLVLATAAGYTLDSYFNIVPQNSTRYLGTALKPWAKINSVDGDFSGTVTASNGVIVDSGRYVGLGFSSTKLSLATTSAVLQVGTSTIFGATSTQFRCYTNIIPNTEGLASIGLDGFRWSDVYSVNGDFSGTVRFGSWEDSGLTGYVETVVPTTDNGAFWIDRNWSGGGSSGRVGIRTDYNASGTAHNHIAVSPTLVEIQIGNALRAVWQQSGNMHRLNMHFRPYLDSTYDNGFTNARWLNYYGVNGSFTGTLDTEVGGSMRLFNLGSDADVAAGDTEYLETSWDTNVATIATKATGTGVGRKLDLLAGVTGVKAYYNSTLIVSSAWSHITMNNTYVNLTAPTSGYVSIRNGDLRPWDAVTPINCGQPEVPWSGVYSVDGDFSGTVTTDTINASGSVLDLQLGGNSAFKSDGTFTYMFRGSSYVVLTSDGFRPLSGSYLDSGGKNTFRWGKTWSVDGSFSGNLNVETGGSFKLFNLGDDHTNTTDTEYGIISYSGGAFNIDTAATGTGSNSNVSISRAGSLKLAVGGSFLQCYAEIRPASNNLYSSGNPSLQWSNVYSVDGTFSGTVTAAETFRVNRTVNNASTVFQIFDANVTDTASDVNSNLLNLKVNGVQKFRVKKDGTCTAAAFSGDGSSLTNLPASLVDTGGDYTWTGENTFEEPTVFQETITGTAASFSGSLISEVGGSYKLYNLGAEGDTDTEYLELITETNNFKLQAEITGSGVVRPIFIDGHSVRFNTSGNAKMAVLSTGVFCYTPIVPNSNGSVSSGTSTHRWSNTYSQEGDFSGDVVMAANVDFTGIPTSDPLVEGRLYNDSGTLKISSGGGAPPP